jgi:hypothetical protein
MRFAPASRRREAGLWTGAWQLFEGWVRLDIATSLACRHYFPRAGKAVGKTVLPSYCLHVGEDLCAALRRQIG